MQRNKYIQSFFILFYFKVTLTNLKRRTIPLEPGFPSSHLYLNVIVKLDLVELSKASSIAAKILLLVCPIIKPTRAPATEFPKPTKKQFQLLKDFDLILNHFSF